MIRREDITGYDDELYLLAVRVLHTGTELVLQQAYDLRAHGYELVPVIGTDLLVWRAPDGRYLTHDRALQEIWTIPEAKEGGG